MENVSTPLIADLSVGAERRARTPVFLAGKSPLTAREMEVLRLVADGFTTKEVAVRLNVKFKTAACHRSRILQKLGVESTITAVRWAIREGLIQA